ncbi:MAG: hypothetical protein Q8O19_00745, partial [Rectinemataceae bacterium]|nr:hypothetical protein [Rectinemataceae bacterium]
TDQYATVLLERFVKAFEEILYPASFQPFWKTWGQKRVFGFASHCGYIGEVHGGGLGPQQL